MALMRTNLMRAAGVRSLAARCFSTRPEPSQSEFLHSVGNRRIFDEDHDQLRETARKFFDEHVVPHHDEWETQGHVSRDVWRKAGEYGLLGIMAPEEYGGLGADLLST